MPCAPPARSTDRIDAAMNNPLIELAGIAAEWHERDVSEQVAWATRRALLDWFATTLPGGICPPAAIMSGVFGAGRGAGKAYCYVDGQTGSPRYAALLNGTASHTVEFDDIFKDGGYHPGSSTIAAALALAQDTDAPLERLHRAVIAGYEVGCRISLAIQPSHYTFWHTTSTVGTIGAAVAAAMMLTRDPTRLAHAMALATSFAGGHQQNLQGEGMAKAMHAGHAAEAGLLAGMAAANGVTGSLDSLHSPMGYAAATSESTGDWDAAFDGVGDWTPIERMTIKNHGCCGHIFPALDGLAALCREHTIRPDKIAAIHVDGYGATYKMCNRPEPQRAQDARFSLQYCLAAQLVLGAVRLDAFRSGSLSRPEIRALMPKITVSEDAELAAAYPRKRMARVAVRLKNGRAFSHFQQNRKGDPENPLSDKELIEKYNELMATVVSPEIAERLRKSVLYGSDVPGAAAHSVAAVDRAVRQLHPY